MPLARRAPAGPPAFRNWAGNHGCRPAALDEPASEAELADLLARAGAAGERVKAVGAGHSWSDAACTDGRLVRLDRMARVLSVDPAGRLVTVEAGIRLRDLTERLDERGLALANLGSISEQSIAGAISTGTHGTGAGLANLASQVVALRLVAASGRVLELSPDRDPEVFRAARVSLGCLGILSAVTLRCEPAYDLVEESGPVPFEDALAALPDLLAKNRHLKLWWLPHTDRINVYRLNPAPEGPGRARFGHDGLGRRLERSQAMLALFATLLRLGAAAPPLIPWANRLVSAFQFKEIRRCDRSDRVLNVSTLVPRHEETEYAIPIERTAEAMREVRALIESRGLRVNFIVEARFAAADDALLSPAHGRDSCHLGAYMYRCAGLDAYFEAFEALMARFGGRPHWGKQFRPGRAELRPLYPEFDRFDTIRRELDPRGMFENAFTRRVFGGRNP